MMEVADEWGLNKSCYAPWKKQLMEEGSLESKKSLTGRPRKRKADDVAKLTTLNRENRGDLTFRELAQKLSRRIGFVVSAATIWRTAKREGWVQVAKYTRPWLTDEQILARLKWAAEKLELARRGKDPGTVS